MVLESNGDWYGEARHLPYGGERWASGTLPTDYRFTGQRDTGLGLYHMGARFYDSYINRWTSPDTIIPDFTNPQSSNRFSYCLGNPLRFVDPTGHYSEDEIMAAFEVDTWDQVLAFFQEGGALEGLWGWLEILRRAVDGDMVMWGAFQRTDSGQTSLGSLPQNMGWFRRDKAGHILVGNRTHSEFAADGRAAMYSLFKETMGTYSIDYKTPSTMIHYRPGLMKGDRDWQAAWYDGIGILIDAVGLFAIANVELFPVSTVVGGGLLGLGFALDFGAATEGFLNVFVAYPRTGRFDSRHILDMAGLIPALGLATDLVSVASNLSGWRVEVTP